MASSAGINLYPQAESVVQPTHDWLIYTMMLLLPVEMCIIICATGVEPLRCVLHFTPGRLFFPTTTWLLWEDSAITLQARLDFKKINRKMDTFTREEKGA